MSLFLLRALSVITGTIGIGILWITGNLDGLEEGFETAFTEIWMEFMNEHPDLLDAEETVIELLVWNFTERFLFFPEIRQRLFDKLLKRALHKWRWERSLKGTT